MSDEGLVSMGVIGFSVDRLMNCVLSSMVIAASQTTMDSIPNKISLADDSDDILFHEGLVPLPGKKKTNTFFCPAF